MPHSRRRTLGLALAAALALAAGPAPAADREVIEARANLALAQLYREVPGSRDLAQRARGLLVIPNVVKGGFILGGAYGEGVLRLPAGDGFHTVAYYSVATASLGLQAGIQESSQALFFLTSEALEAFRRSDGWEAGAGAEITMLDGGGNVGISTAEYDRPVVAIVFGADGLLVGASLEGAKYSRIQR
ncbi:YSC84-related protein [Paralimibaculum aggregatum]|uniref:YSC84-related protein n=1 Tax=Paralimibaculum aggregatum TaxID=3036245 RepID=A0ABQ6LTB4_9RHOB|nr:lipid-binding SYLF domain-containing protein [Limibaculum sp. NKW23]GMG85320.1 YSC84-related protein [Limibaculum sp. NKW23]